MTLPNKITICRICLIPVFVAMALTYGRGVARGEPVEWQHFATIALFVLAAATDGIDGYLARRLKQESRLGEVLDPIADKGLVLSAIITLSLSRWEYEMPDWFPLLVISRDLALVIGFAILRSRFGPFKVKPTWEGKVATLFQMTGISLVLLQWNPFTHVLNVGAWKIRFDFLDIPIFFAGLFTLISGLQYLCRGIRISKEAGKNGGRERSG